LQQYRWQQALYRWWVRRGEEKAHSGAEQTREAATPYGFRLMVRGSHPANEWMLAGTFEPEEVALIQKHLASADVCIDIGANIGFYSCIALHAGKQVVSVEPQPRNLECLRHNVKANGWEARSEIHAVGLGSEPGEMTLYGASGPSASLIPQWADYKATYSQKIPITTLDKLLAKRFAGKRVFIKMDVEGYEFPALKGGVETLRSTPRPEWLVEICLDEFHPSGANPDYQATFELFWKNGYEARTADARNQLVTPEEVARWVKQGKSGSGTINYLFRAR
jgi:FkbM family methyltransferase